MADRYYSAKLTPLIVIATLGLSGCDVPPPASGTTSGTTSSATHSSEVQLRRQATAMQRTILEGAAAGVAAGAGLGFILGGGDEDSLRQGIRIGLGSGIAAGSYVALIQKKYARKERRLAAIKSDLDKNAAEMRTTIRVMRDVLAVQRAELAEIRRRAAAGQASSGELSAELSAANNNLAQMQKAINGASRRQAEFGQTRGLTLVSGGASAIDPDLAALSAQIAAMKAIANDLSAEL